MKTNEQRTIRLIIEVILVSSFLFGLSSMGWHLIFEDAELYNLLVSSAIMVFSALMFATYFYYREYRELCREYDEQLEHSGKIHRNLRKSEKRVRDLEVKLEIGKQLMTGLLEAVEDMKEEEEARKKQKSENARVGKDEK